MRQLLPLFLQPGGCLGVGKKAGQPVLHRRTGLGAIPLLYSQDVSQKGVAGSVCNRTAQIPASAQPRMGSERQDYQIRQQKHKLRPEGQRFFTPFSCCFRIMLCEIYTRKICTSAIGIFSKKNLRKIYSSDLHQKFINLQRKLFGFTERFYILKILVGFRSLGCI